MREVEGGSGEVEEWTWRGKGNWPEVQNEWRRRMNGWMDGWKGLNRSRHAR